MTHDPHQEREERIEELFHEALQRHERERDAWLLQACDGDRDLAGDVRSLLAAHSGAPTFLEAPAWGLADHLPTFEPTPIGSRIGPYQVQRLLGEGGMGSVYLAEQHEPFRRLVALKLIKLGMDTAEVVSRFNSERQALALLNHPHIAAVHDAGVTERGRPYFVMEYVPGERITEYCDRRRLSIDDRLAVFTEVCRAVHHAHCRGVIHRDLKPSNILVKEEDGRPVAKIIDFGVAKATAAPGGERTISTRRGQLIGTPGYMSPEQAGVAGVEVDTRTDVYSLGALLYELLTGCQPLDRRLMRRAADDEVRRLLRETDLQLPSERVDELGNRARRVAARRRCDVRALLRRLRGDLDWIVLKALARSPSGRFASASELAADVEAHLQDESVRARPPSFAYRVRKLASRHRQPVIASVVALLACGAGLAAFGWSEYAQNRRLASDNASMRVAQQESRATQRVLVEENVAMRSACSAAQDVLDLPQEGVTARILNGGGGTLAIGELVELIELVDGPGGEVVMVVDRARAASGRVLLGAVGSALEVVDAETFHVHRAPGPVAPGAYGLVQSHGPVTALRVDGSAGPIQAGQLLGVSPIAGIAGPRDARGAVVGRALEAWDGDGVGTIHAFVAPAWSEPDGPGSMLAANLSRGMSGSNPGGAVGGTTFVQLRGTPDGAPADTDGDTWGGGWASSAGFPAAASGVPEPLVAGSGTPSGFTVGDAGTSQSVTEDPGRGPAGPTQASAIPIGAPVSPGGSTGGGGDPAKSQKVPGGGPGGPATPPGGGGGKNGNGGDDTGAGAGGAADELAGAGTGADGVAGSDSQASGEAPPLPESGDGPPADDDASNAEFDGDATPLNQSWADIDDDGLVDLLVTTTMGTQLLRNAGQGTFQDITPWSNLVEMEDPEQVSWVDLDGDALIDLLTVSETGGIELWLGAGNGVFTEVSAGAGLSELPAVGEVVAFDSDSDGRTDLRVVTKGGALLLLLNDGTGRFDVVVIHDPGLPGRAPPADGGQADVDEVPAAAPGASGKPVGPGKAQS